MTTYTTMHRISRIKMTNKIIAKSKSHCGMEYQVKDITFYDKDGIKIQKITVFGDYDIQIVTEGTL